MCVGILTATRAARIRDLHHAYIAQRQSNLQELCATLDEVVNALTKLCRE
ncbi:hypothetical protein [Streptomyces sp. NPDC048142]